MAVSRKKTIGFHLSSCLPNQTLDAFPKICPIVKIGTAAFIPTIPVKIGSKTNAPPKPAAPEMVAARNEIANNMISFLVKFSLSFCSVVCLSARSSYNEA